MKKILFLLKLTLLLCSFTGLTQPKYFIFEEKGKLGLVDLQGKTVLAPTFNSIEEKQPYFIACSKTKGCSVYNENLQLVLKGGYNSIELGCEGQFIVEKNGKYGVVSEKGAVILPLKYSNINSNKNGYTVKLNEKAGLFNSEGKEIIPISYHWVYTGKIDDNIPIVAELNDNNAGYINTKNEWVIPPTYQYAFAFRQGVARVKKGRNYMYINLKGEPVIQDFDNYVIQNFDNYVIEPSDNTYIVGVRKECKYMVYDLNGNLLDTYDGFINNWSGNAIFGVKKGGKWGYIDGYGKVIVPFEYEEVNNFSEGLASVRKDGKWGYINPKNEIVIPIEFTNKEVGFFKNGGAEYYTDRGAGLINLKGEIIAEPKYDSIEYVNGNIAIVSFNGYNYLYDFVKEKKLKRLRKVKIHKGFIAVEPRCD
ncbi:WG repeat-containing protein [Capnocytophaga gingivalis]|uniref:WG repeat-containing protein n=1 Tax=Capnocytophaga gingivalis TaxID=1017 RepID=A0ABU5YA39_9FLAO|nr:WG repeat-containing protein [Capnocytophaga gingivalis]MEB3040630.1 WG repeat-containing protein [Capnocytophaga gingivalis]